MPPEAIAYVEATLAAHHERINAVHEKQETQDGALVRLEQKVDELKTWIMGALLASVLGLLAGVGQFFIGKH